MTEKKGGWVARVTLWCLLACTALGCAASAAIVIMSLRPESGANMILMGLPLIAGPTAFCAAVSLAIAGWAAGLNRWERRAAYIAGGLAAVVFGALVILG